MAWSFFQPRALHDAAIDLQTLIEAADDQPAKRYVNLLIMDMLERRISERTLRATEVLPGFEGFESTLPQFAVVVNRLKIMSGLDPVTYKTAREGRIDLVVQGVHFDGFTRFDDAKRTATLRLQPAADEPAA